MNGHTVGNTKPLFPKKKKKNADTVLRLTVIRNLMKDCYSSSNFKVSSKTNNTNKKMSHQKTGGKYLKHSNSPWFWWGLGMPIRQTGFINENKEVNCAIWNLHIRGLSNIILLPKTQHKGNWAGQKAVRPTSKNAQNLIEMYQDISEIYLRPWVPVCQMWTTLNAKITIEQMHAF